jgi:hypothetical protein
MSDIVEMLSKRQNDFCDCGKEAFPEYSTHADNCLGNAFKEAADEISRLRSELSTAREMEQHWRDKYGSTR